MQTLIDLVRAPAWPILLWCGLAASLAAALVLPPARQRGAPATPANWPLTLVLGIGVFAPLYGLVFEIIGRADLLAGIGFGTAHGLLALAFATRSRGSLPRARPGIRTVLAWLAYGATLGYLYPVPLA